MCFVGFFPFSFPFLHDCAPWDETPCSSGKLLTLHLDTLARDTGGRLTPRGSGRGREPQKSPGKEKETGEEVVVVVGCPVARAGVKVEPGQDVAATLTPTPPARSREPRPRMTGLACVQSPAPLPTLPPALP